MGSFYGQNVEAVTKLFDVRIKSEFSRACAVMEF